MKPVRTARVVKTACDNGAGLTESFWNVQTRRLLGWHTVATFGNATAALIHAKHIVTGTAE